MEEGVKGAKLEKEQIAQKVAEVRKFKTELIEFVRKIQKEETVEENDIKHWYFQNVARVGGQDWRDFDQEFGRLDCTMRDGAVVDSGVTDEDTVEELEEEKWKIEEIWAK